MTKDVEIGSLRVAGVLHQFIEQEALPASGVSPEKFWAAFEAIIHDLAPVNRALLARRDQLQAEIDAWHQAHPDD